MQRGDSSEHWSSVINHEETKVSSIASLFKSFVILIICLISSVIITEFILMPAELVIHEVQSTGIEDAPPEWQTSDLIDFTLGAGYFLTYFLDFFAVTQFIYTAVRRQKYDVYGNEIEDEEVY